jgi:hypothetical protein
MIGVEDGGYKERRRGLAEEVLQVVHQEGGDRQRFELDERHIEQGGLFRNIVDVAEAVIEEEVDQVLIVWIEGEAGAESEIELGPIQHAMVGSLGFSLARRDVHWKLEGGKVMRTHAIAYRRQGGRLRLHVVPAQQWRPALIDGASTARKALDRC